MSIRFDTQANREASYRAQSHKQGLHLNTPEKRTCTCCGITRNAQTQFVGNSQVCRNCRRPR